jgi:uncharacterized coiled-coil protein SlyX
VLHEGYAYDRTTIDTTGHAAFAQSSSVACPAFSRLNPEATEPKTLARRRAQNRAAAESLVSQRAADLQRSKSAVERAGMLKARLSSVNAKGSYAVEDLAAAAATATHATEDDQASEAMPAVADVAPRVATIAPRTEATEKKHGLRSCFAGGHRPMSAANCERLALKARSVFEPAPVPEHITAARERLRISEQQRDERSQARSLLGRVSSAPPRRATPLSQPCDATASMSPDRNTAPDAERIAHRLQRIGDLEAQLDQTRSERARIHGELASLCEVLESRQQSALGRPAARQGARRV